MFFTTGCQRRILKNNPKDKAHIHAEQCLLVTKEFCRRRRYASTMKVLPNC